MDRIGLFGGSFDPPHVGHLLAVSDAVDALQLDRVIWIPAAVQPLKGGAGAPAAARLAMTRLLCASDARFEVDPIEVDRGGLSYTVDTLRVMATRHPGAALFLLLGTDAAARLPEWREPEQVAAMAEICVLTRSDGGESLPSGLRRLSTRRVDVSSTEIRARVRAGLALTGFVPDAVAEYLRRHDVYA